MKRALALTLGCLALSACGGSGDGQSERTDAIEPNGAKTFEGNGFSFSYPEEWHEGEGEARAGADPDAQVGPCCGAGWDLFAVYIVAGNQSVTEANVDEFTAKLEAALSESEKQILAPLTTTRVDGLPAHTIVATAVISPGPDIHQRETWVYDEWTWYHLVCQARIADAAAMKPGCEQAVASFRVD
jgi:hypothetical protein